MKTNTHRGPLLLASAVLFAAGTASGQTFYYQNAGSQAPAFNGGGTAAGNLATIGFDASLWNRSGSVNGDAGAVATRVDPAGPGLAYDINLIASSLASQAPAGTTLTSVTLFLYSTAIVPDGPSLGFSIYDGYQSALGNRIGTLNLTGPTDENQWFTLTFSASEFAGGIAITSDGLGTSSLLEIQSELSTLNSGAYTPGVSATFSAVPEPSMAAIAGLAGTFALLRRRRA